jgi:D-glycero-alpha-D-manno-heptose-7-phosphate kinase
MKFLFTLNSSSSLREVLELVESNTFGTAFVVDNDNIILGSVTDGDVRRHLLNGGDIEEMAINYMNVNFNFVTPDTKSEIIAKYFDSVRVLPLLNSDGVATDFLTASNYHAGTTQRLFSRSKTPVRISFAGGGSDVTYFFSQGHEAAVVNATINKFSYAYLEQRMDQKISITSYDLKLSYFCNSLEELVGAPSEFSLIIEAIRSSQPRFGFDLTITSDFPIGSGLGGSATVVVNILNCFNEFRENKWNEYELATQAYRIERHALGIKGGWQDQYAAAFGGINYISFSADKNVVYPLRIPTSIQQELESNLFLCSTNALHNSGKIHEDQEKSSKNKDIEANIKLNVKLCYDLRDHLLCGNLDSFAELLEQSWRLKKTFSSKITNPEIDKIYDLAKKLGASGGKLLGAGGGGYLLFYVSPQNQNKFLEGMEKNKLKIERINFEMQGTRSWRGLVNEITEEASC